MNVLVFDIETVPDIESGRRLYDLEEIPASDVARAMSHLRLQQTGRDLLPHHLQRIVAISIALRAGNIFRLWSLGNENSSEAELLQRFYDGIERFNSTMVSWNGCGFDLPVIHYRSLLHGIAAPRYWDTGEADPSFRYNNYLNRFHWRHIDLMDVLAGYNPRAFAPLDQLATMLGLPGKMGMSGGKVWEAFQGGDIIGIRNYCETDVLNTLLIYLRFELMRGQLNANAFQRECQLARDALAAMDRPHLTEFLSRWKS
ncbi:MAG TPA: 3'-5' exonuclease [Gammaproteobacteria bacterium]|nr:3'-5' exonuclease [Gammaproteobacteria bacterium]